ncbi:MAG: hypothetical protein AB8C46_11715 [Burkholderiaceae bacterium]
MTRTGAIAIVTATATGMDIVTAVGRAGAAALDGRAVRVAEAWSEVPVSGVGSFEAASVLTPGHQGQDRPFSPNRGVSTQLASMLIHPS